MPKSSLFARLGGNTPLSKLSPADLANRRAAVEAALAEAQRLHGRAALRVEEGEPGAATALVEAAEALRLAQEKVRDVMAAQVEAEADHVERNRRTAAAGAAAQDKASREVFEQQERNVRTLAAAIDAYAAAFAEAILGEVLCRAQFAENPRLRQDLAGVNVASLSRAELARASRSETFMPPGADTGAVAMSDRRRWKPMADAYSETVTAVLSNTSQARK